MVEAEEVRDCLRSLGIEKGDVICVHSSVRDLNTSRMRRDDMMAQAEALIGGLTAAVGEEGTIAMPTFTFCFEGNPRGGVYHPEKTKSRTGFLTDYFRKLPGVVRSLQPTHSVAAWGRRAKELVEGHEKVEPLGIDSPLHRLAQWGGKVAFLGTNFGTCSLIHVAETVAKAPYIKTFRFESAGWKPWALREADDGSTQTVPIAEVPGCSKNFEAIRGGMDARSALRSAPLGDDTATVFLGADLIDAVCEELGKNPHLLLCAEGECPYCDAAR